MRISFNPDNTYLYQKQPLFKGKAPAYTEEFFYEVVNSNLSVKAKAKKLGLALDTYYRRLKEHGIFYKQQKTIPATAKADLKTEIQGYLNDGMTISEICKLKKLTENQYYKLTKELETVNPRHSATEKIKQISEEQFKKIAMCAGTIEEKCKALGISKSTFFRLQKKFSIQTERKKLIAQYSSITKERFIEVANSNMTYQEKIQTLGISEYAYKIRLAKYNIISESMKIKQTVSEVTKEKLKELIDAGMKVQEICSTLKISNRTYTRLLNEFQIMTQKRLTKKTVENINIELFQAFLDKKLPKTYICKYFGINKTMFYKLLKRHNLRYDYLHHFGEIEIPKAVLEELAASGKSVEEIANILGISKNTYSEKAKVAKIDTPLRKSIDKIRQIPKDEILKDKVEGMTVKEICEKYNISTSNYKSVRESNGLITPHMETMRKNLQVKNQNNQNISSQSSNQ